jgi:hypothetical protein
MKDSAFLVLTIVLAGAAGAWVTVKICGPYGKNSSYENNKLALYASIVVFFIVQFITAKIIGGPTIYHVISSVFIK